MKILDVPQSGSVGGVTSSRNAFGQYRRARAVPVNPNTDRQTVVRSWLGGLAASWADLTNDQRVGWNALAAAMGVTDSLGSVVYPTGFNRFIGTNLARLNMGMTQIPDAPPSSIAPPAPTIGIGLEIGSVGVNVTGATPGEIFSIFAAPYGRPGRTYFSDFRWIIRAIAATTTVSQGLDSQLTSMFGPLVAGNVLAIKIQRCDEHGLLISETIQRGNLVEPEELRSAAAKARKKA